MIKKIRILAVFIGIVLFCGIATAGETKCGDAKGAKRTTGLYKVEQGETLQTIAKKHCCCQYHSMMECDCMKNWKAIYDANRDVIRDANMIYPGQMIKLPRMCNCNKAKTCRKTYRTLKTNRLGKTMIKSYGCNYPKHEYCFN